MAQVHVIRTKEIVSHIGEHGISQEDFEHVLGHPAGKGLSRSTGLAAARDTRAMVVI